MMGVEGGTYQKGKKPFKKKRKGKCHECHEYGHWRHECPKRKDKGTGESGSKSAGGTSSSANMVEEDEDMSLAMTIEDIDKDDDADWVSAEVVMEVGELEGEWLPGTAEEQMFGSVCDMSEIMVRQVNELITST